MKKRKGFTLAELLLVVMILSILFTLSIPRIVSINRNMRQNELDSKAEIVYVTLQNRLIKMKTAGNTIAYQKTSTSGVGQVSGLPNDITSENMIEEDSLVYFSSNTLNTDGSAANQVVIENIIEPSLREAHWVVEYNPETAIIYSVFYSEGKINCANEYVADYSTYDTKLRYKDERIDAGAKVGYYGGGGGGNFAERLLLTPSFEVINKEKLVLHVTSNRSTETVDYPIFKVTLTDEHGNKNFKVYLPNSASPTYKNEINKNFSVAEQATKYATYTPKDISVSAGTFEFDIVLDDLSSNDTRFYEQFGKGVATPGTQFLIPGDDIKIEIVASNPGHNLVIRGYANPQTTNSLFESVDSSGNAKIKYARHLQNLGSTGIVENINAIQVQNIQFTDQLGVTGLDDFYETYRDAYFNGKVSVKVDGVTKVVPRFEPINNDKVLSYTGSDSASRSYSINNLAVKENSGNAGLFGKISQNFTFSNVTLIDSFVKTNNNGSTAGALLGLQSSGNLTINNCKVYLSTNTASNTDYKYDWIDAYYSVGGLVGEARGSSIAIKESFASTVIGERGSQTYSAGGLLGRVPNSSTAVKIEESYADSYLYGSLTGGLVGYSKANVDVDASYAAGYMTFKTNGAGLVLGPATMDNSYTVMHKYDTVASANYYRTAMNPVSNNVYYSATSSASVSATDNANEKKISDVTSVAANNLNKNGVTAFTYRNASSKVYNLMDQGLNTYLFPTLSKLQHFGDYDAEFKAGSLVYYEKYSDGTYGFYGANVPPTLKDDPNIVVKGDGYGIVYSTADISGIKLTIQKTNRARIGETTIFEDIVIDPSLKFNVKNGSDDYYIFPIDTQYINEYSSDKIDPSFYYRAIVKTTNGDLGEDSSYYFFNPHFAKTVKLATEDDEAPNVADEIAVRTARHLYNMSLYYDYYANSTAASIFKQERNIDYKDYDWVNYSTRADRNSNPDSQAPIANNEVGFKAVYNGGSNWIKNVKFIADSGLYAGMFGNNNGLIRNVIIRASYDKDSDDNFYVAHNETTNIATYRLGVLAGRNGGTIENSACDGYYIAGQMGTIQAYENTTIYGGGLVGENTGIIRNSSANIPNMRLSSSFANVYLGGFVGKNAGTIDSCYTIGAIDVVFGKDGIIKIAGFTADNDAGSIADSYCTTALNSSGSTSYGFAPKGGGVTRCYYLNNGAFYLQDKMYTFRFDTTVTSGDPINYSELEIGDSDNRKADESYDYVNEGIAIKNFPFPAVVKDANGNLVHFGAWIEKAEMGTLGFFYWEKEEGGENNGYHLTYVGADKIDSTTKYFGETTLCNSHDDNGYVSEYGYGYFTNVGQGSKLSVTNIKNLSAGFDNKANADVNASNALHSQFPDYDFYAFKTKNPFDAGDTGLTLDVPSSSIHNAFAEVTLNLNVAGNPSFTYQFSPFFANSFALVGVSDDVTITDKLGTVSNFAKTLAGTNNQLEIRSVEQLQYINWNNETKNTTELINGNGNKGKFPYLVYATDTSNHATNSIDQVAKDATSKEAAAYNFRQTHDVQMVSASQIFTPIAGTSTTSAASTYNAVLYAWFGSTYNGESYMIKNLKISSESFNVGLFGTAVGANIKNIIMYSDNKTVIERVTPSNMPGAYSLGGMIGVAYDYNSYSSNSTKTNNYITNCAISGYVVRDGSTNQTTQGEANIGGLVGVAAVNLEKCSSVVDIRLESTNTNGAARWGIFIRSGALAGAAQGYIKDCYTGGEITVSNETMTMFSMNGVSPQWGPNEYLKVFCAGIAGSTFTTNYVNFTGNDAIKEGSPVIENCYTYTKLPASFNDRNVPSSYDSSVAVVRELNSTIICSLADRVNANATKVTINNCYYLDSIKISGVTERGTYFIHAKAGSSGYKEGTVVGKPIAKTYDQLAADNMPALLNASAWNKVTVLNESNKPIDGKFSYPGINRELDGKNFPFPTVIKQKDLTFGSIVNVHYGAWPLNTAYWEMGRAKMDIFSNMKDIEISADNHIKIVEKTYKLYTKENPAISKSSFTFSNDICAVKEVSAYDSTNKCYDVTLEAYDTGTTRVIYNEGVADEASFSLEITAELSVKSDVDKLNINKGEKGQFVLTVFSKDADGNEVAYTENGGIWNITNNIAALLRFSKDDTDGSYVDTLTSLDSGNKVYVIRDRLGQSIVTAEYRLTYTVKMSDGLGGYVDKTDANGDPIVRTFTAKTFIDIEQNGVIGLSNGTLHSGSYLTDDPSLVKVESLLWATGNEPNPNSSDADFYLYLNPKTKDFADFTINDVLVEDVSAAIDDGKYIVDIGTDKYFITINTSSIEDTNYRYLTGTIYCLTTDHADDLSNNNITLKVNITENGACTYDIPLAMSVKVYRNVIISYTNGAGYTDADLPTLSGNLKLRDSIPEEFIPQYQQLIAWSDGVNTYNLGQTVLVTNDLILMPVFDFIPLDVESNGGYFENLETSEKIAIDPVTGLYDLSTIANLPTRDGYTLTGYSTSADGAKEYELNDTVAYADVSANNFTLYAVWEVNE
ncbi:MAG: prepilin-type N-terminal cleavage/methylation domain-containing protein [Erysipelotrichaceae bacterium]|nr:prepilin-type N-terminal cleavage/methylation domain-containing protein [Erysipelotrichaceae bacterium]